MGKLRNEQLNDLYSSGNIIRAIKSKIMRLAGHVVDVGEIRGFGGQGNLRERDHLGDPGVDERIILICILREWNVGIWIELTWFRIGTGGGHFCIC
jgi:hypothetical protein